MLILKSTFIFLNPKLDVDFIGFTDDKGKDHLTTEPDIQGAL